MKELNIVNQLIEKFFWPVSLIVYSPVPHMFILFTEDNTVSDTKSLFFCCSGCFM